MPCSPAQLLANTRNAGRSTGPRTACGKAVSRCNGLKHGMTGLGIALPEGDAEEFERRLAELEAELRPASGLERELVKRVALMTVRLDRSAGHEAHVVAHRVRHASAEYDDARLAEVEHLYAWIAKDPETNARRLHGSPEGLARLVEAMEGLRSDLAHPHGYRWDFGHADHLHHLMGRRQVDLPASRARALSEAVAGRFQHLDAEDGAGLEGDDRRRWAIGELTDLIDLEVAALKARHDGFDREALERDRSEAAGRAQFDASKEAILARKYEAASERALYRALRELREIRAETPRLEEVEAEEEVAAGPPEELGSCLPEPADEDDAVADIDPTSPTGASEPPRRRPDPEKLARKGRKRDKAR
jgi:hypothetical protein